MNRKWHANAPQCAHLLRRGGSFLRRTALVMALALGIAGAAMAGTTHDVRGSWTDPTRWLTVDTYAARDSLLAITNSVLVVTEAGRSAGANETAARAIASKGGLAETSIMAALYLDRTIELGLLSASQVVISGGPVNPPINYMHFGESTLLAFNARNLDLNGAGESILFQGDNSTGVNFIRGSSLFAINVFEGQTIRVIDGFRNVLGSDEFIGSVEFSNRMFDAVSTPGSRIIDVTRSAAAATFAGISGGGAALVDGVFGDGVNDIDAANPGIRYISRATDVLYGDRGGRSTAMAMESLGQLGSVAGVQTTAFGISQTFSELLAAPPASAPETRCRGLSLWATPFATYAAMSGLRVGTIANKVSAKYGGVFAGGDLALGDAFRAGLAFAGGGGHSETKSEFPKTKNHFDFWGVGGYAVYARGGFGVTGDVGYSGVSHEVRQHDAGIGMAPLRSDVRTGAFSAGVTGEYRFAVLDNMDLIPRAGVRFTTLGTHTYHVKTRADGHLSRVTAANQQIWTFPVGVTIEGKADAGRNWTVSPMADVGVVFAAGDTGVRNRTSIPNTPYRAAFHADVVDKAAFRGGLGLKAAARNGIDVRLEYSLQASKNITSHSINLGFGYAW